ncbi:MAG: Nramp family divalent metal transporter, partial [Planctomycetales bacterium]|nr:Nramp family divalent metal transporter [Planctomycetales bacterium]
MVAPLVGKQIARRRAWRFGPGLLVTAAFIGPGTVTKATSVGAAYGYTLLWSVVFAVITAIVFQEMSARLGVVRGIGLGDAIRGTFTGRPLRYIAIGVVVSAIGVGNAAYQTGNLLGAATGLEGLAGGESSTWVMLLSAITIVLLWLGHYQWLTRLLVALVLLMSVAFLAAAAAVRPPAGELLAGVSVPYVPTGSWADV